MKTKLTIIILLSICAILGVKAENIENGASGNDYENEQGTVIQYNGKQFIRVTSSQQFLRSMISGKDILVAKNTEINLTPLLDDANWWQKNNYYFKWLRENGTENLTGQNIVSEEVFDGRQLSIVGYKGINIVGEGNSCIVVEPRYAFCLNFVNCENISIQNLTIGHTEGGYCMGGVIGVKGGSGINVSDCNLYGCGAYGLQLADSRDFSMYDSSIHDCTYGIMTLQNVESANFKGCNFYRNKEYTLIEGQNSNITFSECRFYANNPTSPLFDIDKTFNLSDCHILHPIEHLGTIEMANQNNNSFNNDPDGTDLLGDGLGASNIVVKYKGSKPTIIDFINATLPTGDEGESDCDSWIRGWKRYLRTKKGDRYNTYIIDERNGYVRIEWKNDGGKQVNYHDFCFWNCNDGKHKLFAHSSGNLIKGKAVETECTGLYFYRYDNDTHTITYVGMEDELFDYRPSNSNNIVYLLPRTGKDIVFINGNGQRGTMRWNGNGFNR